MKDLVPKGTGNSRLLRSSIPADITFAEMVTMLRNGTFPVDFAGLNSAGVAVVGSAYSKANVLPDDLCEYLSVPNTYEIKDVFRKLGRIFHPYELLEKITVSKKWEAPEGITLITAILVGGGGGGAGGSAGGGGQGGRCLIIPDIPVTPGESYDIVIGYGGYGASAKFNGGLGGDTTAFGYTAYGGSGGVTSASGDKPNGKGGSLGGYVDDKNGKYGGGAPYFEGSGSPAVSKSGMQLTYTDLFGEDWYGSGGGAGRGGSGSIGIGGPHAGNGGGTSTDGKPADDGFGGGGGGGGGSSNKGANGGSGAVLIYCQGGAN